MESKTFVITYARKGKIAKKSKKTNISILKPTGEIGTDAKTALNIFVMKHGSLKKNEIISIQEIDVKGNPIGEPIKPTSESKVVPYEKRRC